MKTVHDYVADAERELRQKSLHDIQVETALKWMGRALAATMLRRSPSEVTEYAHEAVEHAALTGDLKLINDVMMILRDSNCLPR